MAVTSVVASVYQVATNSSESSVQCEAYSVPRAALVVHHAKHALGSNLELQTKAA